MDTAGAKPRAEALPKRPAQVLIVDDSGMVRLKLKKAIEALGHEAAAAESGKVALEVCQSPVDPEKLRFSLFASGTIKVIEIGNIASGAATFVLETGDGLSDLDFWGVAAFSTNFDFLEQYGIVLKGSALLQINTTDRVQNEVLSLEGIPGDVIFVLPTAGNSALMSGLPGSGKDTWLARFRPDLPVVSLDAVRTELSVEATDDQGKVIQHAREECRELLRSRTSFAMNATNVIRQTRKRWIDLFADYGARVEIVYVEPAFDVILRRNGQRTRPVPEQVVRDLAAKSEVPTWAECHQLVVTEE